MRVARIVKTDDVKSPKALIEQVRKAEDLSEEEEELLSCIVDTEPLSTSFQDVCINKKIIENLRSIVSLPLLYPHHYKSGILSRETLPGALLYGPPGTGKTMVCRALACESGARMLLIKPSDVYRKWLGESEQLANAIFKLAHRLAPCIVFIDEVDAILGARKSGNRSWHSTMLTEFMQAIDGMNSGTNSKDKGVVVVGATNRPFDLDQAILRRLPYRMLIDLPGLLERESILKAHLKGENLVDIDFANVAADTEGYSGSDLKNLCVSAALEALKDCIGGFELPLINPQGDENKESSPNNPPQAPQDANGQAKVTNSERAITMEHIKRGFKQVAASFSFEGNRQLYAWHKVYGTVGN
ncbi:AAA-domain-containing protein [Marasmius fiardii PR-910]|nr:AAA-domain-containing protein [Marasmius fiardii PR-910]